MKLAAYLAQEGKSASALAQTLGTEVSTVTRIARGERKPSMVLAARIARATDGQVQPNDFIEHAASNAAEAA